MRSRVEYAASWARTPRLRSSLVLYGLAQLPNILNLRVRPRQPPAVMHGCRPGLLLGIS